MKKILFVFVLLLLTLYSVAQRPKIGIRGSIGASWFGNSSVEKQKGVPYWSEGDSKFSYAIGITSEIKIKGVFYIQPEISFAQTAGTFTMNFTNIDSKGKEYTDYIFYKNVVKLNQVQIPVFAKLKLGPLNIMAGPCYSIMFANKQDFQGMGNYDKYNGNDIAINTGLSLEIVKKPSISLDLRHYRGLSKFDRNVYMGSKGYHQSYVHIGTSILF